MLQNLDEVSPPREFVVRQTETLTERQRVSSNIMRGGDTPPTFGSIAGEFERASDSLGSIGTEPNQTISTKVR